MRAMEELYARKGVAGQHRMHLGFALGKAFEDLEEYGKAFDYFLEVNRLQRTTYQYAISEDKSLFSKIRDEFSATFFSTDKDTGYAEETPIFILGMPRSGTSLVEQIVSSHSRVFGAGELSELENITRSEVVNGSRIGFPKYLSGLDKDIFEKWGAEYVDGIRKYSKDKKYITDRCPPSFEGGIDKGNSTQCKSDPLCKRSNG